MKNKQVWKDRLSKACVCGIAYVCLDLPFRFLGFLGLIPPAGPKNALPIIAGFICGPAGAMGTGAGAFISGCLSGDSVGYSFVEELGVIIQERLLEMEHITISIRAGDHVVIVIRYPGEGYNPMSVRLSPGGSAANLDVLGILMVREMAVTASYRRDEDMNELKIVV